MLADLTELLEMSRFGVVKHLRGWRPIISCSTISKMHRAGADDLPADAPYGFFRIANRALHRA
ncbi:hypothetical protein [uncultured Sulfitobacter sp.]|uniref:hypothetical protein n=1 Tax=uncultured Sulfitobacter sp. TaxID=191468 RepID=UPI0026378E51|nr:hypothetical protein [uncultured Sulfitobacter sp.]